MSDEWDFYPLRVDDEPASIFLDMGIAAKAPMRGYDRMAYLRVPMRRPREDGLSSQDEYDDLLRLEDAVTGEIAKRSPTLYVGRNTSRGARDFYFYAKDAQRYERAARAAMARFPDYAFEVGHRPDRDWSTYFDFLYPSPWSRQLMLNRRLLIALTDSGDRTDAVRNIDHCVLFEGAAARDAFRRVVEERGFAVQGEDQSGAEFSLTFVRADRPDDMDSVVGLLFEAAGELGGHYDGWGCELVTETVE